MLYPLTFQPAFKERVWGGRRLEQLYGKALPPGVPIGESWEIADRPEATSVIANGPLAGQDLRWLMEHHGPAVLGPAWTSVGRFPLLIKLLDAQDKLSLQVHPPAAVAAALGGEPKTELWYIAQALPGAELYVGLRQGVTRADFERCLQEGAVADCFHRVAVETGDVMFLPSGRVHALGAGLVIFEIQQNSDTTYRVFDWNRVGLDGKPRATHLAEALACIDFNDFEPSPIRSIYSRNHTMPVRYLVEDPLFMVNACQLRRGGRIYFRGAGAQIIGLLQGRLLLSGNGEEVKLEPGQFCLLPAGLERTALTAEKRVEFLHVQLP